MTTTEPLPGDLLHELGDDGGVCGRDVLAGTVGVEDAQGDGLEPGQPSQREEVLFGGDLADRVRHGRADVAFLVDGLYALVAVDGGAAGEHDA